MSARIAWSALLLAACGGEGTTWLGADHSEPELPPDFFVRYEAESPDNTLAYPVLQVSSVGLTACGPGEVVDGAACASGGQIVKRLLGRSPCVPADSATSHEGCQNLGGGVKFNRVVVPVEGDYDVTWWYFCGAGAPGMANVFGDLRCGGLDYQTGEGTGCRSQLIDANDEPLSALVDGELALYFHFPCYTTPWSTLHAATTAVPLHAGVNTLYFHAPPNAGLDAVDLDAVDVQAPGQGTAPPPLWPRLVSPVSTPD